MTFKQLQYFMAVARSLSFTEAARDQFVSQPALSRSIAELERELNVTLLTRDHHSVKLTPAGALLAAELPKLKMELERLLILVQQTDDGILGKLTVGMLEGQKIDESVIVTFEYFRQSVPLVELTPCSMDHAGLVDGLFDGSLDIVVTLNYGLSDRNDLEMLELDVIQSCMAVPGRHPLAGKSSASILDFSRDTFIITGSETSLANKPLLDACRSAGFKPKLKVASDTRTQLLLIESGFGISVFNAKSVAFTDSGLKAVPLPDLPKSKLVMAWKKGNKNPSVRLFVHLMQCCL